MIIYVGFSGDVIKRIYNDHCCGNIEGSVLRKHVAIQKAFQIITLPNGVKRLLPKDRDKVSEYIQSGSWKRILCSSVEEAKNLKWYLIDQLNPVLNIKRGGWNKDESNRYKALFKELLDSPQLNCSQIRGKTTGPGVIVFYHDTKP